MDSSVQIHRSGSVNVLTLSDATGRNALSLRMRELLLDALNACLADTECRAIVLTGAGGNFCAGGDVREMNIHSQMKRCSDFAWSTGSFDRSSSGPNPWSALSTALPLAAASRCLPDATMLSRRTRLD